MLQPRIVNVEAMDVYKLKLNYETGEVKVFDVMPYIVGDWFGELRNKNYFRTVKVIPGSQVKLNVTGKGSFNITHNPSLISFLQICKLTAKY